MKYLGRELYQRNVQTLTEHYKIVLEEIEMNLINEDMDCVYRWDAAEDTRKTGTKSFWVRTLKGCLENNLHLSTWISLPWVLNLEDRNKEIKKLASHLIPKALCPGCNYYGSHGSCFLIFRTVLILALSFLIAKHPIVSLSPCDPVNISFFLS